MKLLTLLLLCFIQSIFTQNLYASSVMLSKSTEITESKENTIPLKDGMSDVRLWGVNYLINFDLSFKEYERLGLDAKADIVSDIYHFKRLGFDAFRVHIFESEISDQDGNLKNVKQLDLMDFLLNELSKNGIKVCITTMRYSSNKGESYVKKWGEKTGLLNNPKSYPIQRHYIAQLISHVNKYNGYSYKNDPNIISFELSNEPNHFKGSEHIVEYINGLVKAVRATGCDKPLFYNFSQSDRYAKEYWQTDIDGLSTQWYTNGLTGFSKYGNQLLSVDKYELPYADDPHTKKLAKMIYEMSPANVLQSSYMYPAMARSLRSAGYQFATQFSYDPIGIAAANEEYPKQYMNLIYTPSKALGMMVAGEVFRYLPLYADLGQYPNDCSFGPFLVDYNSDLALMNGNGKFLYSNSTKEIPKSNSDLKLLAGHGSSSVVSYSGSGAYFLDRLKDGVWRLEVLPDVIHVKDFYTTPCYDRPVSVIKYAKQRISINLDNLGDDFSIKNIKTPQNNISSFKKSFSVTPGVYLLMRKGLKCDLKGSDKWRLGRIDKYYSPKSNLNQVYVVHTPMVSVTEVEDTTIDEKVLGTASSLKKPIEIKAQLIAPNDIDSAKVKFYIRRSTTIQQTTIALEKRSGKDYDYFAAIPLVLLQKAARVDYEIVVWYGGNKRPMLFPSQLREGTGNTGYWRKDYRNYWHLNVLSKYAPVTIFDAEMDQMTCSRRENLYFPLRNMMIKSAEAETVTKIRALEIQSKDLKHAIGAYIGDDVAYRNVEDKKYLVFYGSTEQDTCAVDIGLTMQNASTYGTTIYLHHGKTVYKVPLASFRHVATAINYKPVPNFLPSWILASPKLFNGLDLTKVDNIQISFKDMKHGTAFVDETMYLDRVELE